MIRTINRAFPGVNASEIRKLWPIVTILALVAFNYSILRCMKDSMIVTAAGAEVLPFIKVWAVLPSAVVCTVIFTKLSGRFSQEKVFYVIIGSFLAYFMLFAFVLYPNREYLHPIEQADIIATYLPAGAKGFVAMFKYWTLTIFYVAAEMWSSICLTVLCWGFINSVMSVNEAGRFYGFLNIGSNIAAIAAGQVANFFSQPEYNPSLPFGTDAWEQTLVILVITVTVSGILAMAIFRYFQTSNLAPNASIEEARFLKEARSHKERYSLKQSIATLMKSRYLLYIAAMVVCYSLVINLVEVVWKDQVQSLYPSPVDFNRYMNNVTSLIGIISTAAALLVAKLIRKNGFTKIALITPLILMVTSSGFFGFILFEDSLSGIAMFLFGTAPLAIVVSIGAIQNVLSKGAKYSFFDATKEMAFIPLNKENQIKGKAVIDGVSYRLGKSGGSFLHQALLLTFGNMAMSTPYLAVILLLVIAVWVSATKGLGVMFADMTIRQHDEIDSEVHEGHSDSIKTS